MKAGETSLCNPKFHTQYCNMSSFGQGLAVFLSSKKANSIPHFMQHLSTNPKDFYARYYRGRAYDIIGDKPNAIADYKCLVQNSKGAEHSVMKAKLAVLQGQLIISTS